MGCDAPGNSAGADGPTAATASFANHGSAAMTYDWLIVGAGFAGSVLAERLASQRDETVLVVDRRPHIAGNAFDHTDAAGILIHRYGPHIFHTNSDAIVEYLSHFTDWRDYEHRVLAFVDGNLLPIPINLDTINALYNLDLTSSEMEDFLVARREQIDAVVTSEDVVVSTIGRDLYEKFFRGYTRKQWGLDPSQLSRSVTARIPTRTNRDDRYFTDTFQKMPLLGYTSMFQRMLEHPNIEVRLSTEYRDVRDTESFRRMVFTGPIDEYFDFRLGPLPYRSLRFVHVTKDVEWAQPVATVNYPQTEDYTRVTEYKHLTGQVHPKTSLTYEYPSATGDPYYPIPRPENEALYKEYAALAAQVPDVWFCGRLATYRYYNMDQVVGQALATFARLDEMLGGIPARGRMRRSEFAQ
jgi:UDP-galactopyranose mutase